MIKTITFACVHFTVAFTVAHVLTGSIAVGGLVALVEPLCNTVAYHLHEKAWHATPRAAKSRQPVSAMDTCPAPADLGRHLIILGLSNDAGRSCKPPSCLHPPSD